LTINKKKGTKKNLQEKIFLVPQPKMQHTIPIVFILTAKKWNTSSAARCDSQKKIKSI